MKVRHRSMNSSTRRERVRLFARARRVLLLALLIALGAPLRSQGQPALQGMWSDPPVTIADGFCLFWCSDAGSDRLNALLDDPDNDKRPIIELYREAARHQHNQYVRPRLTAAGLETIGQDPADDPGFLDCEPWGFARQIFAPHQLEIMQLESAVRMRYGEWAAERTIRLEGEGRPAPGETSAMGHSVGRYEGDALIVETTGISANLAPWGFGFPQPAFDGRHSDRLRVLERYTRSEDGGRLLLSATLEDPWALAEPLALEKVWGWAPDQRISPYQDCERPAEFTRGVREP